MFAINTLGAVAIAAGVALAAPAANAHDLSAVETRTVQGLKGPSAGRMLSNIVTGDTALATEGIRSLAGRNLRTRYWTIEGDGGVVPIHSHTNRPAVFTVLTGEIYEYSSLSEERILHKEGGLALEEGPSAHWWLNEGPETVRLIAFDVHLASEDRRVVDVTVPDGAAVELPATKGVELELLGAVDLGKHSDGEYGEGLALTTWRATLEPGGVLADFADVGEPLHTFVWQGSVYEHRANSNGVAALSREEGSVLVEGASGWWENASDEPAVLYFGAVETLAGISDEPRTGRLAHGHHQ